jgi:cbb3-type cytochrome oxidase subunit 3
MKNLLAAQINLAPTNTLATLKDLTVERVVTFLINGILVIAGVIFFFMLVIGGIKWILSGGDKSSTEAARNQITAALIGLVIVFAAWAILTLVGNIFGISLLSLTIPQI